MLDEKNLKRLLPDMELITLDVEKMCYEICAVFGLYNFHESTHFWQDCDRSSKATPGLFANGMQESFNGFIVYSFQRSETAS